MRSELLGFELSVFRASVLSHLMEGMQVARLCRPDSFTLEDEDIGVGKRVSWWPLRAKGFDDAHEVIERLERIPRGGRRSGRVDKVGKKSRHGIMFPHGGSSPTRLRDQGLESIRE